MSARSFARNLWIGAHAALGLDAAARRKAHANAADGGLVRVVLAHGTPRAEADMFRRQLDWASKHFDFVTFEQFKELWEKPERRAARQRPAVLFTFDDGLASNHDVGAPILEEFGTRGLFFVVPGFCLEARTGGAGAAERYFRDKLKGGGRDVQPMTPEQVGAMAARGHTIGNHTFSHARLSDTPADQLHHEIIESADVLDSWIGRKVEAFAWTFYWEAITRGAYQLIRQRHPYCFSPCPGLVDAGVDTPGLIWRTNIEAFATPSTYRFMYSGLADRLWESRRASLKHRLGA